MTRTFLALCLACSLLAAGCTTPSFLSSLTTSQSGGVLRTSSGGQDWQFINTVTGTDGASLSSESISKLAFDISGPDKLWAGSFKNGLFHSGDGGKTWTSVLNNFAVYDFILHPTDSQTLFVAGQSGGYGRVLVTRDGGKVWTQIYSDATTGNPARTIAFNPNSTAEIVIGMQAGALLITRNGGQSWATLYRLEDRISDMSWSNNYGLLVLTRSKGLFRSADSGFSFQELTGSIKQLNSALGFSFTTRPVNQFYHLSIDANQSGSMYLSTDQGLYISRDGGQSWVNQPLPTAQDKLEVFGVAAGSQAGTIYVGAQNRVLKSLDGGATWLAQDTNAAGKVNVILPHPQLPNVAFIGMFN